MSAADEGDLIASPHPFAMVSYELLKLSANAVKLYVILSKYADNQTGRAWPGRATLAAELGYKQARAVDAVIKELEEAGVITVTRTMKPGAKTRERNVYTVKRAHEIAGVDAPTTSAPQRTSTPEGVVRESAPGSAPQRTRVVRENAQELRTNELISEELISSAPADAETGQGSLLNVEPELTPEQKLTKAAQYVAGELVSRHPALKFEAMMGMAKRMMKAYNLDPNAVGQTMENIYTGGGVLTDQRVGQVLEGINATNGRPKARTKDDKIRETLSMTLTPVTGDHLPSIGSTPFEPQLRITA